MSESSTDMGSSPSEIRMVYAHLYMGRENMRGELNGLLQANLLQSPHLDLRLFQMSSQEKQYSFHPLDIFSPNSVQNLVHSLHVFLSMFTSPVRIQLSTESQSIKPD